MAKDITKLDAQSAIVEAVPLVGSSRAIATVSAVLPPKLSDDMTFKRYLELTSAMVGKHPQSVLDEARDALLSTKPFAPAPSEIVDAILAAYKRLNLPLSEDAKRHLSYRKKNSLRYALNADGQQRFAPDAKITTINFVGISGVHANMLMDENDEATVADVEAAVVQATAKLQKAEKLSIADALEEVRQRLAVVIANRKHGPPDAFCGGPVAAIEIDGAKFVFRRDFFAISTDFVRHMRSQYPYARSKWAIGWDGALKEAFFLASATVTAANYGLAETHRQAEDAIAAYLSDLHVKSVTERHGEIGASLRLANRALDVLDKVQWVDPRPLRIQLATRSFLVSGPDDVGSARETVLSEKTALELELEKLTPMVAEGNR